MSKTTLFEELYSRDLYLTSRMSVIPRKTRLEIIEQEQKLMEDLTHSNPVWLSMYRGDVNPFKFVESHRRRKMSRWLGLGRWLPTGFDSAHNAENDFLSEIFDNIEHYRTHGVLAIDNPFTCAVYAGGIGLAIGGFELMQNVLEAGFTQLRSGEEVPPMSVQEVLRYSELGGALGALAGYHRRTRKTNLLKPSIKKSRVWDQAQYIGRKIEDAHMPAGQVLEGFRRPFLVHEYRQEDYDRSEIELKNARRNELFRKLGINDSELRIHWTNK